MKTTQLRKEFEDKGYSSWINKDIYPDGKIYTKEYVLSNGFQVTGKTLKKHQK